jgi:replication factor C subunit 2/4
MNFIRNVHECKHFGIWIKDKGPTCLADVLGNTQLVKNINIYIDNNNIPNILLSGPNGTAKKTIAKLAVKKYLGKHYKRGCLLIDGSIHRGKDTITDTNESKSKKIDPCSNNVMTFSKKLLYIDGKARIIIITNFDRMTSDAQNSLRRVMEKYAKNTRFILICNNNSDIIEAIQSRCVLLKCCSYSDDELKEVMVSMKPNLPETLIHAICLTSNGDIKKAINYLQMISSATELTEECFYKIFNMPSVYNVRNMINACLSKKHDEQQEAYNILSKLINNGYNSSDILDIFAATLVRCVEIPLKTRVHYLQALAECFYKTEISKSDSHLFALVGKLCNIS